MSNIIGYHMEALLTFCGGNDYCHPSNQAATQENVYEGWQSKWLDVQKVSDWATLETVVWILSPQVNLSFVQQDHDP